MEGSCQEGLISQITTFKMFPATFNMVIISKILVIRSAYTSFEALAVMAFFYVFFLYLTLVSTDSQPLEKPFASYASERVLLRRAKKRRVPGHICF
jgi:hypothetical protein